jgi:sugar phosphate isomerase/epimerase
MMTRRQFFERGGFGLAALAASRAGLADGAGPEVALFTKHLQGLPAERLAAAVRESGFTWIEAPVRPGGHVEPERVEDDLPRFAEALAKEGVRIAVLTSAINGIEAGQYGEKVLRAAQKIGIQRYRMGWYRYDIKRPMWEQLDGFKPMLRDLVQMSESIGILPCYQNHSGAGFAGAAIWDMAFLMRDFRPDQLSWCFDIMHATIEGGLSWPAEVALVRDRIGVAYFKDFQWAEKGIRTCPLGEGRIDGGYLRSLRSGAYRGPFSIHVEYLKGDPKDPEFLRLAIQSARKDLEVFNRWTNG